MERTMRRFKEAMSMTPPAFVIETKTSRRRKSRPNNPSTSNNNNNNNNNKAKSFSMGSGEFQTRLFRTNVVTCLKEKQKKNPHCNASSVLLAKGTLNAKECSMNSTTASTDDNKSEKENNNTRQLRGDAASADDTASFDLVLDDSRYEYDERNNSILQDNNGVVAVKEDCCSFSEDDEDEISEVSSIGTNGEFVTTPNKPVQKATRLLMAASFPTGIGGDATSVHTTTTTTTPLKERTTNSRTMNSSSLLAPSSNGWWTTTTTTIINSNNNNNNNNNSNHQGRSKLATARQKTELGHALLQKQDYANARTVLLEATQLYESSSSCSSNHQNDTTTTTTTTSLALALDTYAVACLKSSSHIQEGLTALQRAFCIRSHHLGVWHVDTVDTYNKIAGVHWQTGQPEKALQEYQQVFKVRTALLGPQHPSVAITAHALAKVHLQLGNAKESKAHFALAKSIYQQLGMRYDHKSMAKLLRDEQQTGVMSQLGNKNNTHHGDGNDEPTSWFPDPMTAEF